MNANVVRKITSLRLETCCNGVKYVRCRLSNWRLATVISGGRMHDNAEWMENLRNLANDARTITATSSCTGTPPQTQQQ